MAHQSVRKYHSVGDYMVGKQIGSGSFSIVWHARHRIHGTEVAIKEINTARLNPKLHESLKSEIFILKRINHPNIIRLHDMIEEAGKIYIILEYCRGGDLHVYIQQKQGIIPEQTIKHFMLQLAEGLKVLRDNNLIHRDLKPQNLLLSTNEDNSTLKIADFGFARSLQPRGLAETLCGSPLYMAPEIMQSQKYDAKADLWSVGAILFQLATGKPPYNGSTQLQLLQNIIRATELQFPPEANDPSPHCIDLCKKLLRRNPVERLTFEEFFNHPYFLQNQPDELFRHRQSQYGFSPSERNREESTQEDCLPFILDDDYSGPDGSPSFSGRSTKKSMDGFSVDSMSGRVDISNLAIRTDSGKYRNSSSKTEIIGFNLGNRRLSEGSIDTRRKVVDSLESIDQDYVMVSGPKTDLSLSARALRSTHSSFKAGSPPVDSLRTNPTPSDPVPIIGGATVRVGNNESLESRMSAPGTSQGSMDAADTSEQPPTDFVTRIKSLQRCALAITELVNDKVVGGKQLEALSIQLVILAIWKQALHICHTHAASAVEGSPGQDTRLREAFKTEHSLDVQDSFDITKPQGTQELCSEIERTFLHEVENAEGLVKGVESGNAEMPDAMELIYQCALAWGRNGAVDEYMGNTETAVVFYSKAVRLLQFLLVEAPCLILNPPFSLTNSDRYRIQNYINVLINRQTISQSQRMALFKAEDQPPS